MIWEHVLHVSSFVSINGPPLTVEAWYRLNNVLPVQFPPLLVQALQTKYLYVPHISTVQPTYPKAFRTVKGGQ